MSDEGDGPDDQQRAALARLTDNEKECLRRRLRPQTAKEMALDLGISPHAVEKRLKMARAKLGLSSSLAAARLLEAIEGYGNPVPRPADLADARWPDQESRTASPTSHRRRPPVVILAGVTVLILVAALLALPPQAGPLPPSPLVSGSRNETVILPSGAPGPHVAGEPIPEDAADIRMRPAGADEVAAFALSSFRTMDKDGSGYIELAEAPATGIGMEDPVPAGAAAAPDGRTRWLTGPQGQALWVSNMDTDRDGRASQAEFVAWDTKIWRDHVPANWAWRR